MSNRLAITINKLHQMGRFAYLTVSGKHRQILKAYKTINGKHELCYVRGVEWKKFSCVRDTYTRYKQDDKNVGNTSTTTKSKTGTTRVYYDYTFSTTSGFSGSGGGSWYNDALGDSYSVSSTAVRAYSYKSETDTTITYTLTTVASATATTYADYSKGSTSYGSVYAEEGEYPDAVNGYTYVTTFSEGGVSYTVMKNGSTYYCYCKA